MIRHRGSRRSHVSPTCVVRDKNYLFGNTFRLVTRRTEPVAIHYLSLKFSWNGFVIATTVSSPSRFKINLKPWTPLNISSQHTGHVIMVWQFIAYILVNWSDKNESIKFLWIDRTQSENYESSTYGNSCLLDNLNHYGSTNCSNRVRSKIAST